MSRTERVVSLNGAWANESVSLPRSPAQPLIVTPTIMSLTDLLLSSLPLFVPLALAVLLIRKTGAFEQRAHRQRVEQLLERIAVAVELSAEKGATQPAGKP